MDDFPFTSQLAYTPTALLPHPDPNPNPTTLHTTPHHTQVLWWTCGEAFILVAMACWQILYIRTFFEVKRYV